MYLWDAVSLDVDLVELYKRLGIGPIVQLIDERFIPKEGQEQHSSNVKSICRKLLFEYGTGGISADLRYMATSSPPSLADLREFCLVYDCVDPRGKTQDEDGDIDCDTEELLKTIRGAKDFETISIDITSQVIEAASFLQLYGALVFQIARKAIGKIECTPTYSEDNSSIIEFLLEVFPESFDATEIVWPTCDIRILNTTLKYSFISTDLAIFSIVWTKKTSVFANLLNLKDSVDYYIHSDDGGLDDEDNLGELRPLHIAAYNSSNSCITTLVDVLGCDVNSKAYDGSNAFFWGMSNDCRLDTLELLISRGCDVNNQIFYGPGWQSNMTSFAGFSPLMFAVNMGNIDYVRLFLVAGANTESFNGPLVMKFPLKPSQLFDVHEYEHNGFRFNALHIASIMKNAPIVIELLQVGAIVDARVQPHKNARIIEEGEYTSDTTHPIESGNVRELVHILKTPLHLLPVSESTTATLLVKSGASLLAQDFRLQAAGSCHPDVLKTWLVSENTSTHIALAVCSQKKLPIDCAHRVVEYLVSLHLVDHTERSICQEMSAEFWPWMALSLTHHLIQYEESDTNSATSWTIHKEKIFDALNEYSYINHCVKDDSTIDENYASVIAFTRYQLRASKLEKVRELLDTIKPFIHELMYPIANEKKRAKLALVRSFVGV